MFPRLFLGLSLVLLLLETQTAQAELKAGAARISIVPPFPTMMGGFYDRTKHFEGVHDDIFARALAIDNGTTKLVIIGSELRSVDAELTRLVRDGIKQATGIPESNVLVCCTHNHSGPSYHQLTEIGKDDVEPSLKRFLAKQFTDVALDACRSMVPVRIGFGAGQLVGLTRNRQQKNDLIDSQVGVIRVEALQGRKTIATLFNFTGHPVTIGSDNLLLSGEYPGVASRSVENLLGGVAIATQGACGDITVNRNGEPFQEIERIGRVVAGEVIKVSGLIRMKEDLVLKSASHFLTLPARETPSVEEAKVALEKGKATLESVKQSQAPATAVELQQDKNRVLSIAVRKAEAIAADPSKRETELKAEVQVLQIGDVLLGTIPGEIFVEYGLELRSRAKQDTGLSFCLVGYANGYIGYIVTPRAMETGGYEASMTRVQVNAGRELTEAEVTLIHQLGTK